MIKAIFTNFFGILFSRILGFIRDLFTASILGANIYSDIFFIAFKLPNLFRRIFAEGAFTQAFIPSFVNARYKGKFTFLIFVRLLFIIIALSFLVTFFSTTATQFVAYGFSKEIVEIAAPFVAINFYYLDLIFIVTFLSALLHYKKHFSTTAFSTGLLNLSLIGALFLARDLEKIEIVEYLSWGVLCGGVLQVMVHLMTAKRLKLLRLFWIGFKSKRVFKSDEQRFNRSFIPAIFGSSAAHISAFLDTFLASFLISGSISYLYYANRILQLPLALFAIATATALFPTIAKAIKNSDEKAALFYLKRSFWLLLFLLGFSMVGAIVLKEEIIQVLFQRGAFIEKDTLATAEVLGMYMIGLLPFGLGKIFSLWLYAEHKQSKAALITAYSLGVNIVLALVLINPLEAKGLALASSLGGVVLLVLSVKEFGFFRFKKIFSFQYLTLFLFAISLEYALLTFIKPYLADFI